MRKVQSAPQLMALVGRPLTPSSFAGSDLPERSSNRHAPVLPVRRRRAVVPHAWPLDLFAQQELLKELDAVESEVVLESETNTVGLEAAFCFAEFGAPHSLDAPNLVNGSQESLTEKDRGLAACLATPFEGNPVEEGTPRQPAIISFFSNEEQFISVEIERKHLKALIMNRRHRRNVRAILAALKLDRKRLALMHVSQCFAWSKLLHVLSEET